MSIFDVSWVSGKKYNLSPSHVFGWKTATKKSVFPPSVERAFRMLAARVGKSVYLMEDWNEDTKFLIMKAV